jgi:hypothetical protein
MHVFKTLSLQVCVLTSTQTGLFHLKLNIYLSIQKFSKNSKKDTKETSEKGEPKYNNWTLRKYLVKYIFCILLELNLILEASKNIFMSSNCVL